MRWRRKVEMMKGEKDTRNGKIIQNNFGKFSQFRRKNLDHLV
jgi:hypothetical protein